MGLWLSVALGLLLAMIGPSDGALAQSMLQKIKDRGAIVCAATQGTAGFSRPDSEGRWNGFDVDFCRALAAAIFDDPNKARFVPLSPKDRFTALQTGEVDLLARATTWTLSRDTQLGLSFVGANYYDGQSFMVKRSSGIKDSKALDGSSICVAQGTTTELNLADFFRSNGMKYEVVAFQEIQDVTSAYLAGRCDALSNDISQLAAYRFNMPDPAEHVILPQLISKEPFGIGVRKGDDQWFDIVRWTLYALINAEEMGITRDNVRALAGSDNPGVRRLLGSEGNFGERLGLSNDWIVRIIAAVGNYGESFERNLGATSGINLPRGLNNLWSKGGIQYAPPAR